jgi:DNA-binding CsgD family transcriptional regulator
MSASILLTPIEVYTLQRMAQGMEVKRIARHDGVTRTAVTMRLARIKDKLGTPNSLTSVLWAYQRGLIEGPSGRKCHCGSPAWYALQYLYVSWVIKVIGESNDRAVHDVA